MRVCVYTEVRTMWVDWSLWVGFYLTYMLFRFSPCVNNLDHIIVMHFVLCAFVFYIIMQYTYHVNYIELQFLYIHRH
jgi:hypothetical protein